MTSKELHKLEQNIGKIYIIKFLAMFLVLMPVIVPFFLSLEIGMQGVYIVNATFAVTIFILEIPSGYVSDLLGRRKTLIVSFFLRGIGFTLFIYAKDIQLLIIAEIILGIAVSLFSGSDTALLYDTMDAVKSKKAQIKILGKSLYYLSLGEGCAALIASFLMFYSFEIHDLVVISAAISWLPLFIAFTLIEPKREKMEGNHKENFKYIIDNMFKQSKLMTLIIFNSVFSFSATLIAVWLFQKYWESIHIPVIYFGILWAICNFAVSVSSKRAHKFEKNWGSVNVLILIGLFPIVGYLGLSLVDHFLGFLLCLLFQFSRGIGQVVLKDALNKRVTADFRATANSITQMGTRIFFAIAGPLFGYVIDKEGIAPAAQGMAVFYVFVFLFFVIPLIKQKRNFAPIG